ncbi:MAG: RNA polymerase sigma factor [Armatimonadota bacterium]
MNAEEGCARGAGKPESAGTADGVLVDRAKEGDVRAFEALAERHKDKIHNSIARLCGDPQEAQDLTQEVFVRAFTSIRRFRGASSFQTWLYRIATNMCVDTHRRRKRSEVEAFSLDEPVATQQGEVGREIPDPAAQPEEAAQREELQREVMRAINGLSPKLRPVVILFDIQGLTYEEVAQVLQCPVGTIKSRLFNARMQLRQKLRKYVES